MAFDGTYGGPTPCCMQYGASVIYHSRNHLIISRMICIVPMPRMSMMKQGSICQFAEGRAKVDMHIAICYFSEFSIVDLFC